MRWHLLFFGSLTQDSEVSAAVVLLKPDVLGSPPLVSQVAQVFVARQL
jgi:hypothetical protein